MTAVLFAGQRWRRTVRVDPAARQSVEPLAAREGARLDQSLNRLLRRERTSRDPARRRTRGTPLVSLDQDVESSVRQRLRLEEPRQRQRETLSVCSGVPGYPCARAPQDLGRTAHDCARLGTFSRPARGQCAAQSPSRADLFVCSHSPVDRDRWRRGDRCLGSRDRFQRSPRNPFGRPWDSSAVPRPEWKPRPERRENDWLPGLSRRRGGSTRGTPERRRRVLRDRVERRPVSRDSRPDRPTLGRRRSGAPPGR